MNRIILVGNGFDLAHGLRTSYSDFILWYLKNAFRSAYDNGNFNDALLSIECKPPRPVRFGNIQTVDELVELFYSTGILKLFQDKNLEIPNYLRPISNPFHTDCKVDFVKNILGKCHISNWVDIETTYYKALIDNLNLRRKTWDESLDQLQMAMKLMNELIATFLSEQAINKEIPDVYSLLKQPIFKDDVPSGDMIFDEDPVHSMVVSFNYTSTIEHYLTWGNPFSNIEVNHIHGQLNDPKNPIIFGYGDESDIHYKEMENWIEYGYFRFAKTFWYPKTSNYHKLVRFIESGPFQVLNFGHSLGVTDKTMLQRMLEHSHCKSIKIFYHENGQSNNFDNLLNNLSLIFRDKQAMRDKLVPFFQSSPLPQAT
ncbi:MAG TPA: AbiH family protein [Mucilaginibacter sp.]|nr:AbiH family protein [Mucilaginibacter sp.]